MTADKELLKTKYFSVMELIQVCMAVAAITGGLILWKTTVQANVDAISSLQEWKLVVNKRQTQAESEVQGNYNDIASNREDILLNLCEIRRLQNVETAALPNHCKR